MSKFIVVIIFQLIAFSTTGQIDSLNEGQHYPSTQSELINAELAIPVSNNFSSYDIIDTIKIIAHGNSVTKTSVP